MSDEDFPSQEKAIKKSIQTRLTHEIQAIQKLLKHDNLPKYYLRGDKKCFWIKDKDNTYYFERINYTKTFFIREGNCKKRKCSFREMLDFISQLPEIYRMY